MSFSCLFKHRRCRRRAFKRNRILSAKVATRRVRISGLMLSANRVKSFYKYRLVAERIAHLAKHHDVPPTML